MEINSDFSRRAVVHAGRADWIASPVAGVERRMLDRIGAEVARATSIVRYAPGSRFSAHTHGAGEEFYVLEGVFQDEQGDYPAGTYVRNPPTSSHTPGSGPGCVIFVKLRQFHPDDRVRVVADTNGVAAAPVGDRPGVAAIPLHHDPREDVRIETWAPDWEITLAGHDGFEALVLDGSFRASGEDFVYQSWLRLPPDESLAARAGDLGARLWVKTGHLARGIGASAQGEPW